MRRSGLLAGDHLGAQLRGGEQRIREIRRVVIEAVPVADAPSYLDPSDDRVAIGFGQRGIGRDVVQRVAVWQETAPLGAARMLERERQLLFVDAHAGIVTR
jgi:hypothetical protein